MTTDTKPATAEELASAMLAHLGPPFESGHMTSSERQKLTKLIRTALAAKDKTLADLRAEVEDGHSDILEFRERAETAEAQARELELVGALRGALDLADEDREWPSLIVRETAIVNWKQQARTALLGEAAAKYRELLEAAGAVANRIGFTLDSPPLKDSVRIYRTEHRKAAEDIRRLRLAWQAIQSREPSDG